MEEANAFFRVMDKYGPTIAIYAAFFVLCWKVAPRIVDAWVRKIEAETETIKATGEAVRTAIPNGLAEIKTAHVQGFEGVKTALVATEGKIIATIGAAVGADTDRRIEDRLNKIEHKVTRGSIPDSDAPAPPTARPHRP